MRDCGPRPFPGCRLLCRLLLLSPEPSFRLGLTQMCQGPPGPLLLYLLFWSVATSLYTEGTCVSSCFVTFLVLVGKIPRTPHKGWVPDACVLLRPCLVDFVREA